MSAVAVFGPARFVRLLTADARNVARDPMLVFATLMSLLPSIGLAFARPSIDAAALASFGVAEFSRYLIPVALLLPAFLVGWVGGFLFLEDRDDGPLLAIDVTPVGKLGFMTYRVAATALVTAAITALAVLLLVPEASIWTKLFILVMVPTDAVLAALILPALARNKVEGLALTKLTNIASIVPLLALLPTPFRLIGGIIPTYWLGELLDLSGDGLLPGLVSAALAMVTHALAGILIVRMIGSRAG